MTARTPLRTFLLASIAGFALSAGSAGAVTIGSLAPPVTEDGGCGSCNQFQQSTNAASPSYETPFDGIITSFSMRTGIVDPTDRIALILVYQKTNTSFTLKYKGEPFAFPASSTNGVATFPVSVPVTAGWTLGVWGTTDYTPLSYSPSPFSSGDITNSYGVLPAQDATATAASTADGHRINVTANVEHDADADGFGDETQDCFPADPSRHGDCPDTTAPAITSLKSLYSKFRVNKKGSIAAKSAPKGGGFQYVVSEASTGVFTISRAVKKKGKTTYKKVSNFRTLLTAGPGSVKYSGRYRDSKKRKKVLVPGTYRVTLVATDAAGNTSAPRSAKFTIVK